MQSASVSAPENTPSLPSKQELLQDWQELKATAKTYKKALARIAHLGWKIRLAEGWTAFGFEDEEAMRASLDIPEATYYKWVRIRGLLPDLSLEEFEAIRITNLELLTQIDQEQWHDYPWLEEARTLDAQALADRIASRNLANGNGREPMVYYREKIPYSSLQMIENAVEAFREKHDLTSTGRALELLIADKVTEPDIVLADYVQIRRMLSEFSLLLQQECVVSLKVYDALDVIRSFVGEKYTKALSAARQGKSKPGHRPGQDGPAAEYSGQTGTDGEEVGGVESPTGSLPSRVQ